MGLRPAQGDENGFCLTTALHGSVALPFVIRPERTRISYYVAPPMAACAAFLKESRRKSANAAKLDRKSGVAK